MKKPRSKLYMTLCLFMLLLLGAAFVQQAQSTRAWFQNGRRISTPGAIALPTTLDIRDASGAAVEEIRLSDAGDGKAQFLFGVFGKGSHNYKLILAHTRNVDFTYHVYQAGQTPSEGWISCTAGNGSYYYSGTPLTFTPRNAEGVQDEYWQAAYAAGDEVHSAAVPLYSSSAAITPGAPNAANEFLDCYMLEVNWTPPEHSSKETDMVYLIAQLTGEA